MFNALDGIEVATLNNVVVSINLIQCKVDFNYMVQLVHLMLYLNIIDGGSDTHVLGGSSIKLSTVNKNTSLSDVFGFDSQAARKYNLPIGPHATKTTDTNGIEIILVVAHGERKKTHIQGGNQRNWKGKKQSIKTQYLKAGSQERKRNPNQRLIISLIGNIWKNLHTYWSITHVQFL